MQMAGYDVTQSSVIQSLAKISHKKRHFVHWLRKKRHSIYTVERQSG